MFCLILFQALFFEGGIRHPVLFRVAHITNLCKLGIFLLEIMLIDFIHSGSSDFNWVFSLI